MIVKKFQAPTEKEAILKAKDELGSNAVVLNVKTLKQRGVFRLFKKDVVEITAALEENDFIDGINKKKPTFNKNTSNVINSRMVSDSSIMPQLDENKAFGQMMHGSTVRGGIDLVADDTIKTGSDTSAIERKLDSLQQMFINRRHHSVRTIHQQRTILYQDRCIRIIMKSMAEML